MFLRQRVCISLRLGLSDGDRWRQKGLRGKAGSHSPLRRRKLINLTHVDWAPGAKTLPA